MPTDSAFVSHLGVKIPMGLPPLHGAVLKSIESGRYETREAQAVNALLQPGETVLEVGGGIGFLSAYCAKIGQAGRVVTYEADPGLISVIKEVHAANAVQAEIRNEVLGDTCGDTTLYRAPSFWGSSTLPPNADSRREAIKVPRADVNQALKAIAPDLLIIDIEGGEHCLLEAIRTLNARAVVIELHPKVLPAQLLNAVFFRMFSLGYVYACSQSRGVIVAFTKVTE